MGASVGCLTTTLGSFLILFSRLKARFLQDALYIGGEGGPGGERRILDNISPVLEPSVVHSEPCARVDPAQILISF